MKILIHILAPALIAVFPAAAQLAVPASSEPIAANAAAPATALLDLAAFIGEKSSLLAVSGRTYDPFLLLKDPTEEPEAVPDEDPDSGTPQPPTFDRAAALAAAVPKLPITMVGSGFFMMNGRQWKPGDAFQIETQQGVLDVVVNAVSGGRIRLSEKASGANVEAGPAATPAGMQRGPGPSLPSGMGRPSSSPDIIKLD